MVLDQEMKGLSVLLLWMGICFFIPASCSIPWEREGESL